MQGEVMAKVTIRDVAREAGVSVATVSHVLNKTRYVSPETRTKVSETIEKLSYTPNFTARNFRTGKNNTIGVIVPDISNSYFSAIIEEIEAVVSLKKYNLIVCNTKETKSKELKYIRLLSSGLTDGLIIGSTCENFSQIRECLPERFPVVLIDRMVPGAEEYDAICIQDGSIITQCMDALISVGHRRIGYIAGLRRLSTTTERIDAYKAAMQARGLHTGSQLIRYANSMANSAYECTGDLIDQRCTAIVISNNMMTTDALRCIHARGLTLGKDIVVVGYGYADWRNYIPLNLAMIVQPDRELGRMAGNQILRRIQTPQMKPVHTMLCGRLKNIENLQCPPAFVEETP